jgi:hypothetical protein
MYLLYKTKTFYIYKRIEYYFVPLGILISDRKFRLHLNFIKISAVYTPRSCNQPAHLETALGV